MTIILPELSTFAPELEYKPDGRFYSTLQGQMMLVPYLAQKIIDTYDGKLPDHIFLPARGGLLWGLPVCKILVQYAKDNDIKVPEIHPYVSIYYTSEGKRLERPIFQGLEDIITKMGNGERGLIIEDVFETNNTTHHTVEDIQAERDVEIKSAAPFFKPEITNHPDMAPYLIYLYELNDWIAFSHEKTDFKETRELGRVLSYRGQEFVDVLTKGQMPAGKLEDVLKSFNRFQIWAEYVATQAIAKHGEPTHVVFPWMLRRYLASSLNEAYLPVVLNENARGEDRIEELRKKGLDGDLNDFDKRKVHFNIMMLETGGLQMIGTEINSESRIIVAATEYPERFNYSAIRKKLAIAKKVDFVKMF
ncbi:phosphoribosyltransferase [Pseudomonadota bacterium]